MNRLYLNQILIEIMTGEGRWWTLISPTWFRPTPSQHDNNQHHSSVALVDPIRRSDAYVCLCWPGASLPSHPHFTVQTQSCLATQEQPMENTLNRADSHAHIHTQELQKGKDNVVPLHPSITLCDLPSMWRGSAKPSARRRFRPLPVALWVPHPGSDSM